jgi:hypothetical protein
MRIVLAALMIAALAAPAYAQGMRGKGRRAPEQKSEEQKKKVDAKEKAYEAAIKGMPDKKFDPWGSVRDGEHEKAKGR